MAALLSLCFVSLGCAAQVSLPVVVTDAAGKPVRGLERAEFTLEPSKKLVLGAVEEVAAGGETNATPGPIFVLFDAQSVPPPFQGTVQQRLLELLDKSPDERGPVTLVMNTGEGLRLIHDSSTDSQVLRAALERVRSSRSSSTKTAPEADETANPGFGSKVAAESARLEQLTKYIPTGGGLTTVYRQLGGLQQIARSLQRLPGRKALLWITSYFPIEIDNELIFGSISSTTHSELSNLPPAWEQAVEALNSARVSVYPLQVQGPHPTDPILEYAQRTQYGLEELARATGGQSFRVGMDPMSAIKQTRDDCGPYYLLTVTPPETKSVSWLNLKIRTGQKGHRLRTPKGFFLIPLQAK